MESISSKLRLSLLPYSAAQQPVQCRLQAEVGSSRIAQGILQPYFSRICSCFGQPIRLAFKKKFSNTAFNTSVSTSCITCIISWYMLLFGSASTLRKASRCGSKLTGPLPARRSTQAISLGAFSSGFFSR